MDATDSIYCVAFLISVVPWASLLSCPSHALRVGKASLRGRRCLPRAGKEEAQVPQHRGALTFTLGPGLGMHLSLPLAEQLLVGCFTIMILVFIGANGNSPIGSHYIGPFTWEPEHECLSLHSMLLTW